MKENIKIIFDDIKHVDKNANEYWLARELQKILEYKEWRKFESTIDKAKTACRLTKVKTSNHFVHTDKMVTIGSKTKRRIKVYKLSRYACYLKSIFNFDINILSEVKWTTYIIKI